MKITDTRDNTVLEGELVHTIKAGDEPSVEHMQRYFKVHSLHPNFASWRRPMKVDRLVLAKADGAFYIVPRLNFYKIEE